MLCEFYSIVTNPRRVPDPRNAAEAMAAISSLLAFLHVLPVPAHAVDGLLDLLRRHPVTGGDVFDLQIVATMQANGVERICTFNTDDFTVFPEFSIVTPGLPDNILCPRAPSSGAAGQVLRNARPISKSRDRPRPPVFLLGERSEHFAATLLRFPE